MLTDNTESNSCTNIDKSKREHESVLAPIIVHNVRTDRTNNFSFFIENQRGEGGSVAKLHGEREIRNWSDGHSYFRPISGGSQL